MHKYKTVRLDTDINSEPLRQLSQETAVIEAAKSAKHYVLTFGMFLRRKLKAEPGDSDLQPDNPVVSPWFGIFACSNIAVL
jgi:hypothetical protein